MHGQVRPSGLTSFDARRKAQRTPKKVRNILFPIQAAYFELRMGTSLRDQLLKAGLVSKEQVRQAEKQRRKQPHAASAASAEQKRAAQQTQATKTARDQELNRRKAAKAEAKARRAQIRQLIEQNRLPKSDSEVYYSFQDGKHIRRIAVEPEQRRQLIAGELAIARYGMGYALLPLAAASRIRERDAAAIVDLSTYAADESTAEDDAYKGFEVPDDLMW
jgi:uncharacterized protein YaiL (DUF2058 family)